MRKFVLVIAVALFIGVSWAIAQNLETRSSIPVRKVEEVMTKAPKQRVEIGLVRWGRDLEAAQKESAASGKPILMLFQEVPG